MKSDFERLYKWKQKVNQDYFAERRCDKKNFWRLISMSVEQVKAFVANVKEDQALAKKLQDAEAAYNGDKSDKEAAVAAIVIPIAAEAGFNFTVEDFKAAFDNVEGEASSDELDAVAGGNLCWDTMKIAAQRYVCAKYWLTI